MAQENQQPVFIDISATSEHYSMSYTSRDPPEMASSAEVKAKSADRDSRSKVKQQGGPEVVEASKSNAGERFKCTECNRYSAESDEQLQRHIRKVHRGQNPFQCYMCDYSTYNKPLFEEHVRIHKGIKPFKCQHCPYRSASKKNAKKHELIHRPNNPLKCSSCPFIGRHVRSLNRHRKEHNKTPKEEISKNLEEINQKRLSAKFFCEHCGTDFAIARNLASHQSRLRKCEECDVMLCSKYLYKRHMSHSHAKYLEPEPASFHCSVCEWRGSDKPRILLHLIHHPQPVDETTIDVTILRNYGILP